MASSKVHSDSLTSAVAEAIDSRALIAPGDGVIVGVSGGLDSVVLLKVLTELAGEPDRAYRLTVAHVNHRLRAEAGADESFVADLSAGMQLPLRTLRCDVADRATREGLSTETAARDARYEFFASLADELGAKCAAVAHHADDNVETVLHRILRGTHLRGLAGIPVARPLGEGGVRLVRPLLGLRRDQLHAYARQAELTWRTDHTNADTAYTRNRIRHDVLAMLRQQVNPRVDEALLRLSAAAGQAEQYLAELGAEALASAAVAGEASGSARDPSLALDRASLTGAPPLVRTYALRAALERVGAGMGAVGAGHLSQLDAMLADDGPTALELPGQVRACRQGDRLIITRRTAPAADSSARPVADEVTLNCPGLTPLAGGRAVAAQVGPLDRAAFRAHCQAPAGGVQYLDADCLTGPLTARPRRDGDMLWPLGSPGRQSVGDLLTNAKVPSAVRDETLCVCDELGIVCVMPLRIDERVKVTPQTARAVVLKVIPATDT